jgi:hypothetical protein
MAMGVKTRIIYGALAIMTIILSMGENTMAQTKSTTVVRNMVKAIIRPELCRSQLFSARYAG